MDKMFEKRNLLWASVAVLVLLVVLVLFSIPMRPHASDNEHFGNIKEVYTFAPVDGWVPVELEGDTDVFPSAEMQLRLKTATSVPDICDFDTRTYVPFSEICMTVRVETTLHQDLMLTSAHYVRGVVVDDGIDFPHRGGSIERRGKDGEWEMLRGLRETVVHPDEETGTVTLSYNLPASAAGEYRFTFHFRTYTHGYSAYGEPYDPDTFSTGDELYTVSYIVDIPEPKTIEPSGKQLDLLAFTLTHDAKARSQAKIRSQFEVVLRADGIEPPYIRSYETRLQRLDGDRWCDVESDNPWDEVVYISIVNPTATVFDPDGESETCLRVTGRLHIPESGSSYRLILGFTEKKNGRGKMYPLTIYFDIPEEE